MPRNQSRISAGGNVIALLVLIDVILLRSSFISGSATLVWVVAIPLLLLAIYNRIQKKTALIKREQRLSANRSSLLN
ncbi:MAG: hypothetical protein ACTHMC_13510 [Pseudobacter sp.]|uniref:hypothetical protein n=1 Tax=Pseudobacter sp. TaxID=2045420 RepID=UPI003F803C46